MSFSRLFEAPTLPRSGLHLTNRLVMAPMPTFAADPEGDASEAEIAYYRRRAGGGVAVVVTAGCSVEAAGDCFPGQWRADSDGRIASLERVAETIRAEGALAVLQLCHAGAAAEAGTPGPDQLDDADARRLIRTFASAAGRGAAAGFDGVEIHGGHGYLPQQFFSRGSNSREWSWGGSSVAKRSRFAVALVELVRESTGGRSSIWFRLTPEERGAVGITIEDTAELAAQLEAGGVEAFDVSVRRWDEGSIRERADQRPRSAVLSEALSDRAAVLAVGGIDQPDQALRAIEAGASLVGLGHCLLAEPDWPRRVREDGLTEPAPPAPDGDRLKSLDVPSPVIDYLREKAERHPPQPE